MVPLDRTMTSSYTLSIVTMSVFGLATIMNAKLLPAAITQVRRITLSYPSVCCSIRYSSVTRACTRL